MEAEGGCYWRGALCKPDCGVRTLALAVRDNSVAAAAMPLPCVATAVVRTPK